MGKTSDAVAEGVSIASAAARLTVRNHILVSTIAHDGTELFAGIASPVTVMRYHSLLVERQSLPAALRITAVATDDASEIHAMRHATLPIWGVQFHPESILTPEGPRLLAAFLGDS